MVKRSNQKDQNIPVVIITTSKQNKTKPRSEGPRAGRPLFHPLAKHNNNIIMHACVHATLLYLHACMIIMHMYIILFPIYDNLKFRVHEHMNTYLNITITVYIVLIYC